MHFQEGIRFAEDIKISQTSAIEEKFNSFVEVAARQHIILCISVILRRREKGEIDRATWDHRAPTTSSGIEEASSSSSSSLDSQSQWHRQPPRQTLNQKRNNPNWRKKHQRSPVAKSTIWWARLVRQSTRLPKIYKGCCPRTSIKIRRHFMPSCYTINVKTSFNCRIA